MERCKVICHMMTSIDGKIDGQYMEEENCNISGEFYDKEIWKMGNANGSGCATAQMYFANENIDYSQYETINIEYTDYIIKSDYYWVVFDRKGRCNWNTNKVSYGGKTASIVMCLTKQVSKQYLAHLKKLGISYIISGEKEIDFPETLKKLKDIYGIETLILTGGAIINGVFHEKGLIDEISLVIGPYIEGNHEFKCFAELNNYTNHCYKFQKANPMQDGGVQLILVKD